MTHPTSGSGPADPLDAAVADYLQKVEAGTPPDRGALLAAHPDLADRLRAFFADLDGLGGRGEAFRLPDLALPEDFGDYEILGELGRGGMGVVYRARQKSLGRVVALKMILSGPLAGAEAGRRFREEAETVSRLDHPHVVPVYEVGEHRGLPYFTTKLVEGRSLTACLDRYAGDPRAAARLLATVCGAVHHAHQRGVLHRDLKPGNILVDAAGGPHVTDFGLARRVEAARTLTATGAVLGTPEYMAPEQAAGKKDLTTAADVYGLGAVLYALLTGRPPFQGPTVYDTLRRVVEDAPVPPRKVRPGVPPDLEAVCLKCLEKDPARRYGGADALAADLGRYLAGQPVTARPPGRLGRLSRWARRKPAVAALYAATCAAAVLVGVAAAVAVLWREAEDASLRKDVALRAAAAAGKEKDEAIAAAGEARRAVERDRDASEREREKEAVFQYGRTVQLAHRVWRDGDLGGAVRFLDGTPERHRGWEWHYVRRLCHAVPYRPGEGPPVPPDWHWTPGGARRASVQRRGLSAVSISLLDVASGRTAHMAAEGLPVPLGRPEDADAAGMAEVSPDGTRVLTCTRDAVARVWDLRTGTVVASRTGLTAARWAPDGRRVLTTWRAEWRMHTGAWDPGAEPTGGEKQDSNPWLWGRGQARATLSVWSPDGTRILRERRLRIFGRDLRRGVQVEDVVTGRNLSPVLWTSISYYTPVVWSPAGDRILVNTSVRTGELTDQGNARYSYGVQLWDTTTGRLVFTSPVTRGSTPGEGLAGPSFSPDGTLLFVPRENVSRWWAWDLSAGELVLDQSVDEALAFVGPPRPEPPPPAEKEPKEEPPAPKFPHLAGGTPSPDGTRVLTTDQYRGRVRVWDASTGAAVAGFSVPADYGRFPQPAVWGPGGKVVVTLSDEPGPPPGGGRHDPGFEVSRVRLWDPGTGTPLATLPSPAPRVFWSGVSPDGRQARAYGSEHLVSVIDAAGGGKLAVLRGHAARVTGVSVSPDGAMVATTSEDDTVRVWDAATWLPFTVIAGRVDPRAAWVSWEPGRPRVAAAGRDGRVRLWDALTGVEQAVLPPRLPDGVGIATGPDGTPRPFLPTHFSFGPDGTGGVVGTDRGSGVVDLRPARVDLRGPGHVGGVGTLVDYDPSSPTSGKEPIALRTLAWTGDGARLFTGGHDGTVRAWDARTGKPLPVGWRHGGPVTVVALSPDGVRVLSAAADGTASVRDARTGLVLASLVGHTGAVTSAAFSPNGLQVVTTSRDGTARVWLAVGGDEVRVLRHPTVGTDRSAPLSAAWSPDGARVAAGRGRRRPVQVWDVRSGQVVAEFGRAPYVSWSPDGSRLLTFVPEGQGSDTGQAELWALDADRPRQVDPERVRSGGRTGVAWSRDGSRYLIASGTNLAIRDGKTGEPLGTLDLPKQDWEWSLHQDWGPYRASFDPSGTRVLWRTGGGLQIWNVETRKAEMVFGYPGRDGGDGGRVYAAAAEWSPDGARVATAHGDGTARVWDAVTGKLLAVMERSRAVDAATATWSPDGAWALTAGDDGRGCVWDARTGEPVLAFPAGAEDRRWPDGTPIRVAPTVWRQRPPRAPHWDEDRDQAEVLARSADGAREVFVRKGEARGNGQFADVPDAEVRDAATEKVVAVLKGHAGPVFAAALSPDGARAVTWGRDDTVRVWDAATGAELLVLKGEADGLAAAPHRFVSWSPDGHRILTAAPGRGATILDATPLGR